MTWKCDACGSLVPNDSARCTCGYEQQMPEPQPYRFTRKKVLLWLSEIVSIFGLLYCMLGYVMVASFSVAAPERKNYWVSMGKLYISGTILFSVSATVLAIVMFKARKPGTVSRSDKTSVND